MSRQVSAKQIPAGQISISVRSVVVGAGVAVALLLAYLMGGAGGGGSEAVAAGAPAETGEGQAQERVLTMMGTGAATAVPDELEFSLRVALTRDSLDTALADASAAMSRVLAALKEHGVGKEDVQTTGLSMNAVYDYHQYSPPTVRGYRVEQRAQVHIGDLSAGGKAVAAAVETGGNDVRVGNIRLLVGDTDAVMEEARTDAVEQARAKAEQYAAASGQVLGEVVTLREVRSKPLASPVVAQSYRAARDLSATSAVPIRAGENETTVTVKVVWELE